MVSDQYLTAFALGDHDVIGRTPRRYSNWYQRNGKRSARPL